MTSFSNCRVLCCVNGQLGVRSGLERSPVSHVLNCRNSVCRRIGGPLRAQKDTKEESAAVEEDVYDGVSEEFLTTEPVPPEFDQDFWEGEKFELLGTVMDNFLAIIVVLGLVIGGFAAKTFNDGATVFLKSPTAEGQAPEVFIAPDQ